MPRTARELCWMMEGRLENEWNHTAAMIANFRASMGSKGEKAELYHPLHAAKANAEALRQLKSQMRGNQ